MSTQNIETRETLYDKYCQDHHELPEEEFNRAIDDLEYNGYIVNRKHEDILFIEATQDLKWGDFCHIDDPIKTNILLYLVDNPSVFFVLYNTQKGKLRISASEMKNWSQNQDFKMVAFKIMIKHWQTNQQGGLEQCSIMMEKYLFCLAIQKQLLTI